MAQAGAEFAEFVLQAAFGSKKSKTVQAYVDLSAESEAYSNMAGASSKVTGRKINRSVSILEY